MRTVHTVVLAGIRPSRVLQIVVVGLSAYLLISALNKSYNTAIDSLKSRAPCGIPDQLKLDNSSMEATCSPPNQSISKLDHYGKTCKGFPNMTGITLVLKTGASEAYEKMPMQLLTTLHCLPDFLLFSDLDQSFGPYHAHNVLDRVNKGVKVANDEFILYDAQLECPISQEECMSDVRAVAWDLDKYKFLNMIVRAWEMRPNNEWYVFAEADTYLFWRNIVQYLQYHAQPQDSLYVGNVALVGDVPFAHGGSGYVISGALLKQLVEEVPDLAAKYDAKAPSVCCGDFLVSLALREVGAVVKQAHPMFNGDKPNTLPFGPSHWCQPILTLHHMNSEEINMVWQYEQRRNQSEPLQIKELYHAFFEPYLVSHRDDWDNFSDDVCYYAKVDKTEGGEAGHGKAEDKRNVMERYAHSSSSACANLCAAADLDISEDEFEALDSEIERRELINEKYKSEAANTAFHQHRSCFQWRYHNGTCCTSRSFKLGKKLPETNDSEKWISGWFVDGIKNWVEAQGDCSAEWKEAE